MTKEKLEQALATRGWRLVHFGPGKVRAANDASGADQWAPDAEELLRRIDSWLAHPSRANVTPLVVPKPEPDGNVAA